LRFEYFELAKTFFICVKLWTCKIFNQWEIIPIKLWQFKLLCFTYDFLNTQKCSFKKCPITWVALLIVVLLYFQIMQLSKETTFFINSKWLKNVLWKKKCCHNILQSANILLDSNNCKNWWNF
jgi:hypothetical protein